MSIVISTALVLAGAGDGLSLDHPIIGSHNVVTSATIAADEEASGYPASNLANPTTFLEWRGTTTGAQELTITTNEVDAIDYVGIAKHNFGTGAIAISLGYYDGVTWVELVDEFIPADDSPLILRFTPQSLATVVIALAAGAVIPRAAVVYCGKLLVLERKIYVGHTPAPHARKTTFVNGRSESGNFLGRIELGAYRETSIPISLISPAWYREYMDPFLATGKDLPFFFGWRPLTYPQEVGYLWLMDDPMPVPTGPSNLIAFDMKVGGVV